MIHQASMMFVSLSTARVLQAIGLLLRRLLGSQHRRSWSPPAETRLQRHAYVHNSTRCYNNSHPICASTTVLCLLCSTYLLLVFIKVKFFVAELSITITTIPCIQTVCLQLEHSPDLLAFGKSIYPDCSSLEP